MWREEGGRKTVVFQNVSRSDRGSHNFTNVVFILGGSVEGKKCNLDEPGFQGEETNVELSRDHHSFVSLQKMVSCTCYYLH